MEKQKKAFGEVWSTLTTEQAEYLRDYINRQRKEAMIYINKKLTKEIKKEINDKENEVLELEKINNNMMQDFKEDTEKEIKNLKSILVKVENSIN